MTIIVDPGIRILPDDHQIFVLHPGSSKRFYTSFRASDAVFLDLPGILFPEEPSQDSPQLRDLLRMARRIATWRNNGSKDEDTPSRDPNTYSVDNPSKNPPKIVHAVIELYSKAKAGDLILIPGKGYNSTVYIGEFVGNFDKEFSADVIRYTNERAPARKVNWLPSDMAKGQFNRRLVRLMQNRQAIIQVTQEDDRREVYNVAYGDYVWRETSGNLIKVTEDEIDLNDLNKAVDLTNYFAAQYLALKKGELIEFTKLSFHDAIDQYYDKKFFGGVNVEIHSPGYFGRQMRNAYLAGYVSAMLALSGSAVSAQDALYAKVENSANSTASICDMQLEADIRETMEVYANIHLWEDDICPRRKATKETVGLKTDVTVKKENPDPEN